MLAGKAVMSKVNALAKRAQADVGYAEFNTDAQNVAAVEVLVLAALATRCKRVMQVVRALVSIEGMLDECWTNGMPSGLEEALRECKEALEARTGKEFDALVDE